MDSNAPDTAPPPKPMTSWPAVQRFCRQCLQAEPAPDFPGPELLRQDDVQEYLYTQLFAPSSTNGEPPLPPAYALRVLKPLVGKIEESIDDWDKYGVSDNLVESLANSRAGGSQAATALADAVKKSKVVYYVSALEEEGQTDQTDTEDKAITLLENRATIAAAGTTGIRTWEAALHLGAYLCENENRDVVQGKRVLELGAGTGYVAILCAKHLGAASCVATDGSPEVVEGLLANLALNGPKAGTVVSKELPWGPTPPEDWMEDDFDTILGADITFDARDMPDLLATIQWCLSGGDASSTRAKTVIIAATERNKKTFETFTQLAAEAFDVDNVAFPVPPRADQAGPFYSDAVPIHICRLVARG